MSSPCCDDTVRGYMRQKCNVNHCVILTVHNIIINKTYSLLLRTNYYLLT